MNFCFISFTQQKKIVRKRSSFSIRSILRMRNNLFSSNKITLFYMLDSQKKYCKQCHSLYFPTIYLYSLMSSVARGILIALFFACYTARITFQNGVTSEQVTSMDLDVSNDVLVQTFSSIFYDVKSDEKLFLGIKSSHKNKKQAYKRFVRKYTYITKKLLSHNFIPNEEALVKSKIHQKYYQRAKKWEFSQIFVLLCFREDCDQITSLLGEEYVEKINSLKDLNYLNEKMLSLRAFNAARRELQNFLENRLHSKYKILHTKDIEITGKKIENEERIEEQIEQEYNWNGASFMITEENDYGKEIANQSKDYLSSIKVLFKIGVPFEEQEEESTSEESISQFEENLPEFQYEI